GARVGQPRVLEIRARRLQLRLRGGERRLRLRDLVRRLPLLEAQRRLRLTDLRREARRVLRVIVDVGLQLVGRDDGGQLARLDLIPFFDVQVADLPRDLRADDDVVGRDDAGQSQR